MNFADGRRRKDLDTKPITLLRRERRRDKVEPFVVWPQTANFTFLSFFLKPKTSSFQPQRSICRFSKREIFFYSQIDGFVSWPDPPFSWADYPGGRALSSSVVDPFPRQSLFFLLLLPCDNEATKVPLSSSPTHRLVLLRPPNNELWRTRRRRRK